MNKQQEEKEKEAANRQLLLAAEVALNWLTETYEMSSNHYVAKGLREAIAQVKKGDQKGKQ